MEHWINPGLQLVGKTVQLIPLEEKYFEELIACAEDNLIWEHYLRNYGNRTLLYEALYANYVNTFIFIMGEPPNYFL